jgi:hypothetical protein
MKYVLSASILALAVAILIYALMPRYYLVIGSPTDFRLVQVGPFATQAGCEGARLRIPDAMFGNSDFALEKGPAYQQARDKMSRFLVCVPSR